MFGVEVAFQVPPSNAPFSTCTTWVQTFRTCFRSDICVVAIVSSVTKAI